MIGTVMYHFLESWSYMDSLYFSMTTLATVGYGDLHPTSKISKLFTVAYIIVGASMALFALTSISSSSANSRYSRKANEFQDSIDLNLKRRRKRI